MRQTNGILKRTNLLLWRCRGVGRPWSPSLRMQPGRTSGHSPAGPTWGSAMTSPPAQIGTSGGGSPTARQKGMRRDETGPGAVGDDPAASSRNVGSGKDAPEANGGGHPVQGQGMGAPAQVDAESGGTVPHGVE